MADDPTETEGTETETSDEPRLSGAAAQSALKKERKARAEAEKRAKDLEARFKRLEDAEKTETERLRSELEDLKREQEQERARVERERVERERSDRVRRAAREFDDPDDAVAILSARGDLDDIEDDRDAERAVKALAKEKPRLLKQQSPPSAVEQVLQNGVPTPAKPESAPNGTPQPAGQYLTPEQLVVMTDEQQQALKQSNPDLYRRSLEVLRNGPETTFTVA